MSAVATFAVEDELREVLADLEQVHREYQEATDPDLIASLIFKRNGLERKYGELRRRLEGCGSSSAPTP